MHKIITNKLMSTSMTLATKKIIENFRHLKSKTLTFYMGPSKSGHPF